MGKMDRRRFAFLGFIVSLAGIPGVRAAMPAFDVNEAAGMSSYASTTFQNSTGDVIKIGVQT